MSVLVLTQRVDQQMAAMAYVEPAGARLRITRNPHDFGDYFDVVVEYDPNVRDAVEYAFKLESEAPSRWDGDGG